VTQPDLPKRLFGLDLVIGGGRTKRPKTSAIDFSVRSVAALPQLRGHKPLPQAARSQSIWWRRTPTVHHVLWEDVARLDVHRGDRVRLDVVGKPNAVLPSVINLAIGLALHARGCQILHACGVARDGLCAALMGPPGSGKSTTVLAAGMLGLGVVSDEIVPFREEGDDFIVPGGNPRIRIKTEMLPKRIARRSRTEKTEVDVRRMGLTYADAPSRLALLVILGERRSRLRPDVRTRRLRPAEALLRILESAYNARVMNESEREAHFRVCTRLAKQLPCYSLSVREGSQHATAAAAWIAESLARSGA
jgi:hypothetical protein